MSFQAKVVNQFQAGEHDNHIYQPGDTYPAEGYEADAERVAFLSELHPRFKKIFLADIQEIESAEDSPKNQQNEATGEVSKETTEVVSDKFPKHVGGGTFELSNGEKVKGKEEAIQAEEALKE